MTIEAKPLAIDITSIKIEQMFGYQQRYQKVAPIKHRRKKINDVWYDTKKSDLIYYTNKYNHCNDFKLIFIYKTKDGEFFRRTFDSMCEEFTLIRMETAIKYLQEVQSLF